MIPGPNRLTTKPMLEVTNATIAALSIQRRLIQAPRPEGSAEPAVPSACLLAKEGPLYPAAFACSYSEFVPAV
jgi:hypothetical protein